MLRECDVSLGGIDDTLCARLQRRLKLWIVSMGSLEKEMGACQRNDFGGILRQLVRKLFVVADEVRNVDVAVVLLHEHVLTDLFPVAALECGGKRCAGAYL